MVYKINCGAISQSENNINILKLSEKVKGMFLRSFFFKARFALQSLNLKSGGIARFRENEDESQLFEAKTEIFETLRVCSCALMDPPFSKMTFNSHSLSYRENQTVLH